MGHIICHILYGLTTTSVCQIAEPLRTRYDFVPQKANISLVNSPPGSAS